MLQERAVLSATVHPNPNHPITQLAQDLLREREQCSIPKVYDHGTWSGSWAMPSRTDFERFQGIASIRHSHDCELTAMLAQKAGRKEMNWKNMTAHDQSQFQAALDKHWKIWLENEAVEVLTLDESTAVLQRLLKSGQAEHVLQLRTILTDKNDGLRTATNPLPLEASARLIAPGFKDAALLEGQLRTDAPTGSRNAQTLLCLYAGANPSWHLSVADVRSAFLKGKPYVGRELYVRLPDGSKGPIISGADIKQLASVKKGIFGLADAPREWYLRLSECLLEEGWNFSLVDGAFCVLRNSTGKVCGLIVCHVDDLLFTGDEAAMASLMRIGDTLGFGKVEHENFVWCGKRFRREVDGTVRVSMKHYHENLKPVIVSKNRRCDLLSPLSPVESSQLKAMNGSLQWLVAQLRWDLGFRVSSLAGETGKPTVGSLLRGNAIIADAKASSDFEITYGPMDLENGGILVVTDSALGNVNVEGHHVGDKDDQTHSQATYLIGYCDPGILDGKTGRFVPLDGRSHRLPRVTRSSYGGETMSFEEGVDAGQLLRGMLAELRGHPMNTTKHSQAGMDSVPCMCVVDAKDVHDKISKDTASWGSMKSMAYTIAGLKQMFRRPNMSLRWTATENMFVDAGTKDMDSSHYAKILQSGLWSVTYCSTFIKAKKTQAVSTREIDLEVLPGEIVKSRVVYRELLGLAEKTGWLNDHPLGKVQIARNAASFRTSEPRHSPVDFPIRNSYAMYNFSGAKHWRQIECNQRISNLANSHAGLPGNARAAVLVTVFSAQALPLS